MMPVASPERKKKRISTRINCVKRGSGTEKTLQKTKCVNVNGLAIEMDEGMRKTIAENKERRLMHI